MKRTIIVLLILIVSVSFCACETPQDNNASALTGTYPTQQSEVMDNTSVSTETFSTQPSEGTDNVPEFSPTEEAPNTYGNTNSNSVNGGILAADGDWIYYDKIRENVITGEKQNTQADENINIYGGYLYFTIDQSGGICRTKISTIGTNNVDSILLYSIHEVDGAPCDIKVAKNLIVYDGWAYFTGYTTRLDFSGRTSYVLYKASLDGTKLIKLCETQGEFYINIVGSYLYFIGEIQGDDDGNYLYRINIDDYTIEKLYEFSGGYQSIPSSKKNCFGNGKLYYATVVDSGVYMFDLETYETTKIISYDVDAINLYENCLYFVVDGIVYFINLETNELYKACEGISGNLLCVTEDYVQVESGL